MGWFQRLFTTGYFLCLVLFATCLVALGDGFFYGSLAVPYWADSYAVGMVLLGPPAGFIVLRDLSRRSGLTPAQKRGWAGLFLMFWPSILVYLVRYEWSAESRSRSALSRG